jgi:putative colanic acid biosynthesis acetyltransferase WcaF
MPDPRSSRLPSQMPALESKPLVDLSKPDSSLLVRGRPLYVEAAWSLIGAPLLASRLLFMSRIKVAILRIFGARIGTGVLVKPGVRVKFPWYLSIGDHCWIGEDAWIDNLAHVTIEANVCISQGVYLCTGNHDWRTNNMRLFHRPIILQEASWVGARSTVCPGVTIGRGAVLAAGSIVTRSIPPWQIYGGNPACFIRTRTIEDHDGSAESS